MVRDALHSRMLKTILLSCVVFLFLSFHSLHAYVYDPYISLPHTTRAYYSVIFYEDNDRPLIFHVIEKEFNENASTFNVTIPGDNAYVHLAVLKGKNISTVCTEMCERQSETCEETAPVCLKWNTSIHPSECIEWSQKCVSSKFVCTKRQTHCWQTARDVFIVTKAQRIAHNTFSIALSTKNSSMDVLEGIFLVYTASGYTKPGLWSTSFSFPTISYPFPIFSTRVGISGEDVVVKGGKSTLFGSVANDIAKVRSTYASLREGMVLSSFPSYFFVVEREYDVIKETFNLFPYDTFLVTGEYSSSPFLLYLPELAGVLLGAGLLLGLFSFVLKRFSSSSTPPQPDQLAYREIVFFSLLLSFLFSIVSFFAFIALWILLSPSLSPVFLLPLVGGIVFVIFLMFIFFIWWKFSSNVYSATVASIIFTVLSILFLFLCAFLISLLYSLFFYPRPIVYSYPLEGGDVVSSSIENIRDVLSGWFSS